MFVVAATMMILSRHARDRDACIEDNILGGGSGWTRELLGRGTRGVLPPPGKPTPNILELDHYAKISIYIHNNTHAYICVYIYVHMCGIVNVYQHVGTKVCTHPHV